MKSHWELDQQARPRQGIRYRFMDSSPGRWFEIERLCHSALITRWNDGQFGAMSYDHWEQELRRGYVLPCTEESSRVGAR